MPIPLPPMDPVLARDYPRALRDAYRNAVRSGALPERHQHLLRLGEMSIAYFGSLAFADYRRARHGDPDPRVEGFLASTSRFTMGQYLALFRLTQRALGRPEIFELKRHEVNVRLKHAQRWVSAVRAIEYAQKIGASDIGRVVDEGLKQPTKGVRWLAFWDELVAYRNHIAHADANGWPLDAVGYFEAMTSPLEAALIEALRTEYIGYVLLEYPIAELADVRRSRDGWVQRFDGEYHGVPLLEEVVRDKPPDAWESQVGCMYVLQGANGKWSPYAEFCDLRDGVPKAISSTNVPDAAISSAVPPGQSLDGATGTESTPETVNPPRGHVGPGPGSHGVSATDTTRPAPDQELRRDGHGSTPTPPTDSRPQPTLSSAAGAAEIEPGASTIRHAGPLRTATSDNRTAETPAADPWFPSFSPWMLWGVLSFGLLAGVGFLVTATRIRDVALRNAGLAYSLASLFVLVAATIIGDSDDYPTWDVIVVSVVFATWLISTVHALWVNPRVKRERADSLGNS